jgi:hypothetical protein
MSGRHARHWRHVSYWSVYHGMHSQRRRGHSRPSRVLCICSKRSEEKNQYQGR